MPVEYKLKRADTIGRTVVEEVGWNTKQDVLWGRQETSKDLYVYLFQLNLRKLLINLKKQCYVLVIYNRFTVVSITIV